MSMSQEEIEALMNGLDVVTDEKSEEENETLDVEDSIESEDLNSSKDEDDIMNLFEEGEKKENLVDIPSEIEESTDIKNDISDVLNEIENMQDDDSLVNIEDKVLVEEDLVDIEDISLDEEADDSDFAQKAKTWTEDKITKGEFPFPAEPSTKVVSQLNEVANDSEEKAGQIFDVLSFILDDNAVIQKNNKQIEEFLTQQTELLNTLTSKFPNIKLFEKSLEDINLIKELTKDTKNRLNEEDMKLFEAMELMQFHDINRQKIERVMSVIRKLTVYLNNLFEEDEEYEEIAVAKHIHGDSTSDLVGAEDLDALIAEFNK